MINGSLPSRDIEVIEALLPVIPNNNRYFNNIGIPMRLRCGSVEMSQNMKLRPVIPVIVRNDWKLALLRKTKHHDN